MKYFMISKSWDILILMKYLMISIPMRYFDLDEISHGYRNHEIFNQDKNISRLKISWDISLRLRFWCNILWEVFIWQCSQVKVKVIGALDRYSSLSMPVYKGPGCHMESVALRQSWWYEDPAMKLTSWPTCANKLVQNKSLPLDIWLDRARGAGSPLGLWRALEKPPTTSQW